MINFKSYIFIMQINKEHAWMADLPDGKQTDVFLLKIFTEYQEKKNPHKRYKNVEKV